MSKSTSGTSHFAQPTDPRNPRELQRLIARRSVSIRQRFLEAERTQREEIAGATLHPDNRVFCSDCNELIAPDGAGFRCGELEGVYADPPYTADNYSRFYHVLEELVHYRYPKLLQRNGRLTKGRYTGFDCRFQSSFCAPTKVEAEWAKVIRASAGSGAVLVASYATPSGLLLKTYRQRGDSVEGAVERFLGLFRRHYRKVELRRQELEHSGQGDGNIGVEELLVIAQRPKKGLRSLGRALK